MALLPDIRPVGKEMPLKRYYHFAESSENRVVFENIADRHGLQCDFVSPVWNIMEDNRYDILPRFPCEDESCNKDVELEIIALA